MKMTYSYADDFSLMDVAFTGLTGREYVTCTKDALNVMKIENPALGFRECVEIGIYNEVTDEEFAQMLATIKCIKNLWNYPDDPEGSQAQPEMNILALLANAIELITRQNAELRKYWADSEKKSCP